MLPSVLTHSTDAIILANPMRYLVPLGTAGLAVVMFVPPIALVPLGDAKVIAGSAIVVGCVLWMLRSAWRAPFELTVESAGVAVRRWSGRKHYAMGRVRKWWFAVPDGPPTSAPPPVNGVLYLVLDDRTRFRAEVTADEAVRLVAMLPAR